MNKQIENNRFNKRFGNERLNEEQRQRKMNAWRRELEEITKMITCIGPASGPEGDDTTNDYVVDDYAENYFE